MLIGATTKDSMTRECRELMEAVADIAMMAGGDGYYGGDSRADISKMIMWAVEFEAKRKDGEDGSVTYDGMEYIEAIEEFAAAKLEKEVGAIKKGDPDDMNGQRSVWGAATVAHFQTLTRTDDEDAIADLLSDLMHLCDDTKQNFTHQLVRARGMYHDETHVEGSGIEQ